MIYNFSLLFPLWLIIAVMIAAGLYGIIRLAALSRMVDRLHNRIGVLEDELVRLAVQLRRLTQDQATDQAAGDKTGQQRAADQPDAGADEPSARAADNGRNEASDDQQEQPVPPPPPFPSPPPPPSPGGVAALPSAALSSEETFGAKWTVWIGGLALALGGIFLVRYSIEHGYLGPGVRVLLGLLFAGGLAWLSETGRRRQSDAMPDSRPDSRPAFRSWADIPGILMAAALTTGFATIYAAYALYDLIPAVLAFIALAILALAALFVALLHSPVMGPVLAGLGLVGASLAPALVSTGQPSAWGLFPYLLLVFATSLSVAWFRQWVALAYATTAISALWVMLWYVTNGLGDSTVPLAFYILGLFLATLAVTRLDMARQLLIWLTAADKPQGAAQTGVADTGRDNGLAPDVATSIMLAMISFVLVPYIRMESYSSFALLVFSVMTAGQLATAWHWRDLRYLVPWSGLLVVLMIAGWHFGRLTPPDFYNFAFSIGTQPIAPPELVSFIWIAFGFAALYGLAGVYQARREPRLRWWTGTAVLVPLLLLVIAYWQATGFAHSLPFGLAALGLAGIYVWWAEWFNSADLPPRFQESDDWQWHIGIYAAGAVAGAALALTMVLERGWLTVALALMIPALAFIALRRPVPVLRIVALVLTAIISVRLALKPTVMGPDVGDWPVLNWLLWGYGMPAAGLALAAYWFRQRRQDIVVQVLEAAALLFTAVLFSLEVRHLMNHGDIYARNMGLGELGLQATIWLGLTMGIQSFFSSERHAYLRMGSVLLGGLALVSILFGLLLVKNPWLGNDFIGKGALFNDLLPGYLVPGIMALLLYRRVQMAGRPDIYVLLSGAAGFLLVFSYLTLETRALFHSGYIVYWQPVSTGEFYSYSLVWLGFGGAMLFAGGLFRSIRLRKVAFGVLLLTVLKVFLLDMSELTGLYRAFSFMGLGAVLVAIGWLYQRYSTFFLTAQPEEAGRT